MKVGDRIRVFEITEKGQDYWHEFDGILGIQRAEQKNNSDANLVYLVLNDFYEGHFVNFLTDYGQVKHVATMVIKKLK